MYLATHLREVDICILDWYETETSLEQDIDLTPDPPRVEILMTIQPLTQKSERPLGQA